MKMSVEERGARKKPHEKRLLVIDDNRFGAGSARSDALRQCGYRVLASTDPESARRIVENNDFDSILYKLELTEEGIGLVSYLRERQPDAKIVVYSSRPYLEKYAGEIRAASAVPLEMVKTPSEMVEVL